MNEDMKYGGLVELQGIKEEISTIIAELKRKGLNEPKGFSVLRGYIDDMVKELQSD